MDFSIRELSPEDSLEDITELLHRAYARLAEQGLRFVASHQDVGTTRLRVEAGHCLVALSGAQIVGTITFYAGSSDSKCEYYQRSGVARFGQFAVEPSLQGRGIGMRLLATAESESQAMGCSEMALDTAEGAHELIALYTNCGYSPVGIVDWDSTNYVSVVMAKTL